MMTDDAGSAVVAARAMNWHRQLPLCLGTGALILIALALAPWSWLLPALVVTVVTLLGLPLGAIALLLCHRLCGGAWGNAARPHWQRLLATLPVLAAAALCLLPWLEQLYPALTGDIPPPTSPFKTAYLQGGFFYTRTALYLGVWIGLAALLSAPREWPAWVYAASLVLWLWSLSFFAIDWYLSVTPAFYSDIFGLWLASFYASGAAFVGIFGSAVRPEAPAVDDLSRLGGALLVSWGFLGGFQWILIWSTNLPPEIGWYLTRREGLWPALVGLWFGLFFAMPALLLLSGQWQRRWLVRGAPVLGLAGYLLHGVWLLLPAYRPDPGAALVATLALLLPPAALIIRHSCGRWRHG